VSEHLTAGAVLWRDGRGRERWQPTLSNGQRLYRTIGWAIPTEKDPSQIKRNVGAYAFEWNEPELFRTAKKAIRECYGEIYDRDLAEASRFREVK